MLTLILLSALILFNNPEPGTGHFEYRIVTAIEHGGFRESAIVSQNSILRTDTIITLPAEKYIFQKNDKQKIVTRVDSVQIIALADPYATSFTNFHKVAWNDAVIAQQINDMGNAGWELVFATSGMGASDDGKAMITKYHFRKWVNE